MNIAICYLTHLSNFVISSKIYKDLENAIKFDNSNNNYDIYKMINTDNLIESEDKTYTFTWEELRKKYNHENRMFVKDYMGVCHLPLFYLQELHPEYDYYIFYESDLYFTGFKKNVNPFNHLNFENYDITFAYNRINNPNWFWVHSFEYNLPDGWIGYEGLLNSYIISNKALTDLKEFCCNGKWHGHHELMVNSFFINQQDKYKISYYTNFYNSLIEWRDFELMNVLEKNHFKIDDKSFIHPIKNTWLLNMVKNI